MPNRLSLREYDLNLTALTDCDFLSSVLVDSVALLVVILALRIGFSVIWQLMPIPFSEWISLCGTWTISKSLPPSWGCVAVRPKRLPDLRVNSSLNLFCKIIFRFWYRKERKLKWTHLRCKSHRWKDCNNYYSSPKYARPSTHNWHHRIWNEHRNRA